MRRAAIVIALLSSNVSASPLRTTSDEVSVREVVSSNSSGQNVIRGRAILSRGSFVRTCAGSDVNLIPDSPQARELMTRMFGNLNEGLPKTGEPSVIGAGGARYTLALKTTRCDGQGYFAFRDVPRGVYYVTANIFWGTRSQPPTQWSEGDLMQRVEVTGDQTKEILIWSDTRGRLPRDNKRLMELF